MSNRHRSSPLIIAGPCAAESLELMDFVAEHLATLAQKHNFTYVFKASFDKANRTSQTSARGPGLQQALRWFETIRDRYKVPVLTDVHESHHVAEVAEVCEYLQIPAFLCRQTDLVVAAAASGRHVNIKKGQFLAPGAMAAIGEKAKVAARGAGHSATKIFFTERGTSFGYGDLVVDMRSFAIMASTDYPVLLDITHSTQKPAAGGPGGQTSSAERRFAPLLARAATATGYLDGYFLEVHRDPPTALSDKDAQLNPEQAAHLIAQVVDLWNHCRDLANGDEFFQE